MVLKNNYRIFSSVKTGMHGGNNLVLSELHKYYIMTGVKLDFCKHGGFSKFNAVFSSTCLKGMLEGNKYSVLDITFPFVFSYDDTLPVLNDEAPLIHTNVRSTYRKINYRLTATP